MEMVDYVANQLGTELHIAMLVVDLSIPSTAYDLDWRIPPDDVQTWLDLIREEWPAWLLKEGIAREAAGRVRVERAVAEVVDQLRTMADQIERESATNIETAAAFSEEYATYGRVAAEVARHLTWGPANTNLSFLIEAAADADMARTEQSVDGVGR
jgi:hypothetical protein